MMPLRAAIPNTVKNPTREPSEMTPPVTKAASTPPTSADGRVKKASAASRQLPKAACKRRKTPTAETSPKPSRRPWAQYISNRKKGESRRQRMALSVILQRERCQVQQSRKDQPSDVQSTLPGTN